LGIPGVAGIAEVAGATLQQFLQWLTMLEVRPQEQVMIDG
jgi:hypothetical protein